MVVDLFLVYQFIRRLATPFNKWEAYKQGIIDKDGKVLIKSKDFTKGSQRKAWGIFDRMIANLKKLLAKVPGGSSQFASYAAALFLIKEYKHFTDESLLNEEWTDEQLDESMHLFHIRYNHYTILSENVNGYFDELDEKLKASDDMGVWVKDFQKSDAPQFKGKSQKKRQQMAVAAKLDAMDEELQEGAFKRIAQVQSNKADRMASNDKKGLDTYKKKPKTEIKEAASPRWKKAGPNGEIQATIGGKKYQIEKSLDHNERHKGEWKVMVWDKRRNSWEWETTEYGKANAKDWIMDRLKESATNMRNIKLVNKIKKSGVVKSGSMSQNDPKKSVDTKPEITEEMPANAVSTGAIANMDASGIDNKKKKKKIKDMMRRTLQ